MRPPKRKVQMHLLKFQRSIIIVLFFGLALWNLVQFYNHDLAEQIIVDTVTSNSAKQSPSEGPDTIVQFYNHDLAKQIIVDTVTSNSAKQSPSEVPDTIEASSANVYYSDIYWNDFNPVQKYLNQLATGDERTDWRSHLLHLNKGRPFKKVLVLSCGNGWVERDMHEVGLIESAVGVDINRELLDQAEKGAAAKNLPFSYFHHDSNKYKDFPGSGYDLVLNHASLHHVAYIDFHTRAVWRVLLRDGGILVNYEFTGPHRNQYPQYQWEFMENMNDKFDKSVKRDLAYPHLPTMLVMDPSEAIHSDLIVKTLHRYFTSIWDRKLNGAIAYELLSHVPGLKELPVDILNRHIDSVLNADQKFAKENPESYMFWYSIMRPKALVSSSDMEIWTSKENFREKNSQGQ